MRAKAALDRAGYRLRMPDIRLVRRPLNWDLTPVQVLRLVRAEPHPVALFGAWAGGCDIVGSRPRLVRSGASGPLDDVLDENADAELTMAYASG